MNECAANQFYIDNYDWNIGTEPTAAQCMTPCSGNTYQVFTPPFTLACFACPSGQTNTNTAIQSTTCFCPINSYSTPSGNNVVCTACPAGQTLPTQTTGTSTCLCPPGTYGQSTGTNTVQCVKCAARTTSSNWGAAGSCPACAPTWTFVNSTLDCLPCAGSVRSAAGAITCAVNSAAAGQVAMGSAAVRGAAAGVSFFGTRASPASIVAVRESNSSSIAVLGALQLAAGETPVSGAAAAPSLGLAFFILATTPTRIVAVSTTTAAAPVQVGSTLALGSGENLGSVAVFDSAGGFLYVGTGTIPARVVQVQVNATGMARVGSFALAGAAATGGVIAATIDANFAYFVTCSWSGPTFGSAVTRMPLAAAAAFGAGTLPVAFTPLVLALPSTDTYASAAFIDSSFLYGKRNATRTHSAQTARVPNP